MSLRQLLLSINPPGFYSGTEDFENENIRLKAGVLRRTLNPKDISFVEIPPMKKEAIEIINWIEQKEEQRTGVTKSLEGEVSEGKTGTAFELGVNREAALKRLRLPLRSLQIALDWEFKNRIDLIKQTYSEFDVEHIANEDQIMEYIEEVENDPDFYFIENEGDAANEKFFAIKYREVKLGLEQNDKGEFVESEEKGFFKIKPQYLSWEGDVRVDIGSILIQSEELEKEDTLRFANLLVPLFQLPPEIALKPAKQLCRSFNKDPKRWLPESWITDKPEQQAMDTGMMKERTLGPTTVVPPTDLEGSPKLSDRLGAAFRGFRSGR